MCEREREIEKERERERDSYYLTDSRFFTGSVRLLVVTEAFVGVSFEALAIFEGFETVIDLQITVPSLLLPMDNSDNLPCIPFVEQKESCSPTDILGFNALSLLNECRFFL